MQRGERRDCRVRRRNATGNRFQEGGAGGPLQRRISPAVKRADKCGGHLRQHRPMRLCCPPHSHHPSSLHSKRHWVRNQSRDLSAFYPRTRTFFLDTTRLSNAVLRRVILITKLPRSTQRTFPIFKTNTPAYNLYGTDKTEC